MSEPEGVRLLPEVDLDATLTQTAPQYEINRLRDVRISEMTQSAFPPEHDDDVTAPASRVNSPERDTLVGGVDSEKTDLFAGADTPPRRSVGSYSSPAPEESTGAKDKSKSSATYFRPMAVDETPSGPQSMPMGSGGVDLTAPLPQPAACQPALSLSSSQLGPSQLLGPVTKTFPLAVGTSLQKKLDDVASEVALLNATVTDASAQHVHPLEVRQILESAENLQRRAMLSEEELEQIGWPSAGLKQMRVVLTGLQNWEESEAAAKEAIADDTTPLKNAIEVLQQVLSAWCQLCALGSGPISVNLGLDWRGRGAAPMIVALLDEAGAKIRLQPTDPMVGWLERLLEGAQARRELQVLGIVPAMTQTLQELREFFAQMPAAERGRSVMHLTAPDYLWRAVAAGDVQTVDQIIRHGELVSGRTLNNNGHTVFWEALAQQKVKVALLLFRYFPPDSLRGIMIDERDQRGDSLLHLACTIPLNVPRLMDIFKEVLRATPSSHLECRNANGQNFLHVAAGHIKFNVLRLAASIGLDALFSVPDCAGWTVRMLIEHFLAGTRVGDQQPVLAGGPQPGHMARWCQLGPFRPSLSGAPSAFSDVTLTVQDKDRGSIKLHSHRVVLGANSKVWHDEICRSSAKSEHGNGVDLHIDPSCCCSAVVVNFVLGYIYSGETACSFKADGGLIVQVAKLCARYRLPSTLLTWSADLLLTLIADPYQGSLVSEMLCDDALWSSLEPSARVYVARFLFRSDAAWNSCRTRSVALQAALADLETMVGMPSRP